MMRRLLLAISFFLTGLCCSRAQSVYTLSRCLEEGLANNYSLRISRNREHITANKASLAHAGFLPVVDVSAGYSGNLDNNESRERNTGKTVSGHNELDRSLRAGVDLHWTLFDGFEVRTTYRRLKELEQMGELNTRIVLEDFVAEVAAEYFNYVQQKIRLKNFRYAVSLSKERLRIVEERYHIGNFSRLDYQQAKVDFNADSAQYMKQQERVVSSRIRLNELMAAEEVDRPLAIGDTLISVDERMEYARLWEDTRAANAALLQAEHSVSVARLDYRKLLSRNYPYVRLDAGYDYGRNRYEKGNFSRRSNWGLKGGISVGINVWDGKRNRDRRNAHLEIENARLEKQELELGLKADLTNLWQAYRNNLRLLKLERQNLVVAKENHAIATERYLLGNLSGFAMREAQKSLLDAEERILSAEYETKICEISLLQISGSIMNCLLDK